MMGYVPPRLPPPDYRLIDGWEHPRLGVFDINGPPDLGQQEFGSGGPRFAPLDDFGRYRQSLYGPRGFDWLPIAGYGLVLSVLALIVTLAIAIGGAL